MKIALCLSGQPRGLFQAFDYVHRNLLSKFDVEVFIHTWQNSVYTEKEIIDLYAPAAIMYEQPLSQYTLKDISKIFTPVDPVKHPVSATYSAYYSMFHSSQYRIEWEHRYGRFDWVVRSRFDFALNGEIPFDLLRPGIIYIPNDRQVPTKDFGNDQFAFGCSATMTQYMNTFLYLSEFAYCGVKMNGEDMMSANLKVHNLVGNRLEYVDMNHPFEPGPYNGSRHSLVRDDMDSWKKL